MGLRARELLPLTAILVMNSFFAISALAEGGACAGARPSLIRKIFSFHDYKGFSSRQELLKDYKKQLTRETLLNYTDEETNYIRKREGFTPKMEKNTVRLQYWDKIRFVRVALEKKL